MSDPYSWPDHGEIDMLEAVNQANEGNQMTLHTTSGCSMDVRRRQTGEGLQKDCDHSKNDNAGCGVKGNSSSFGQEFNDNGGGIMAMEWREAGIRMWQFARSQIPDDITNRRPNPAVWGTAAADFPNTDCNVGNHFRNQSIIANIALCGHLVYGEWADSGCKLWNNFPICRTLGLSLTLHPKIIGPGKCEDLVADSPDAFTNAFWEFGQFQVYQPSYARWLRKMMVILLL
jgi:hypothetical protein